MAAKLRFLFQTTKKQVELNFELWGLNFELYDMGSWQVYELTSWQVNCSDKPQLTVVIIIMNYELWIMNCEFWIISVIIIMNFELWIKVVIITYWWGYFYKASFELSFGAFSFILLHLSKEKTIFAI